MTTTPEVIFRHSHHIDELLGPVAKILEPHDLRLSDEVVASSTQKDRINHLTGILVKIAELDRELITNDLVERVVGSYGMRLDGRHLGTFTRWLKREKRGSIWINMFHY